jgi:hypothetical protein
MKICPLGAEVFHADERMDTHTHTDMKLIVAFRNSVNAPEISYRRLYSYGMFHDVGSCTGTNFSVELAAPIFRVLQSNIPGLP